MSDQDSRLLLHLRGSDHAGEINRHQHCLPLCRRNQRFQLLLSSCRRRFLKHRVHRFKPCRILFLGGHVDRHHSCKLLSLMRGRMPRMAWRGCVMLCEFEFNLKLVLGLRLPLPAHCVARAAWSPALPGLSRHNITRAGPIAIVALLPFRSDFSLCPEYTRGPGPAPTIPDIADGLVGDVELAGKLFACGGSGEEHAIFRTEWSGGKDLKSNSFPERTALVQMSMLTICRLLADGGGREG
mmetsp:Transcript_17865/g.36630  ORF Transcript_17865/g.36630 Transcript_17865/m.36630 type:complete len:240 (-) Transcript_17865:18-737(-)